ncbi:DUF5995 family protein [Antrihabitans cavernicola]|uniref:Uncharacterized protein n=1 Tax=Antrihabitans cavernicola TaxID=2495913 RepID=A0A5A7SG72_9NOCA|nr:DUF5995 family protein [Spelaeibacter cavernicola]KAA0023485.1 hypothetical protein FOY51_08775 [Spelaeibacter cavernicola]
MHRRRRKPRIVSLATLVTTVLLAPALSAGTAAATPPVPAAACGSPLSAREIDTIAHLSDPASITGATTLAKLDDAVAKNKRLTDILVSHKDWRGMFPLGLDAVEQDAVMPLQHTPGSFVDTEYAHRISLELISRFLRNIHAEFTGGTTTPAWAHYFELTRQCTLSPARVAMAGYNSHLTVDLAESVAAVGTRPENAPDFFKIVDSIATHGGAIVDRTKAEYGADLGPLWRFYFVGEGLDRVVGQGVASGLLLRAADNGYNVITFSNGLALQNPQLAAGTQGEIDALWRTTDVALEVLTRLGGL